MKHIIILFIAICIMAACNNKPSISDAQAQLDKYKEMVIQDSIGQLALQKYLDWEASMKGSYYVLGWPDKKAKQAIDSIAYSNFISTYRKIPIWYYQLRKRENPDFFIPDSLITKNY